MLAAQSLGFFTPRKLLEMNRIPTHPWLDVALAYQEIAIQQAHEALIFVPHEELPDWWDK